ncbi:MAG: efflux RND transporter periplasmic adaptor subunit [Planctomycetia bacterium]|nr:efflux RND transporter periplasmic adaptor subunit [Planctomycetia bacterium]
MALSNWTRGTIFPAFAVVFAVFSHPAAVAQPAAPVVAARVATMKAASGQPFVGTVLPARTSDVGSAVDGRLVDLPILDGQHVTENEPIAQLLRGLLEIEREGAVAEFERRRQVLAELQAGSRPEEIEQSRALVAGFEARLAYARSRLTRLGRLAERGTSTVDELQDAQTELQAIEAQLRGSRAALSLAEAGPRREQIAQAAAAAAVQEAEVERIDDQLKKHTIRSPFSGWVVQRFTEKGQWLSRGGLVARIAELDTVEIETQVPESSIASLRVGADVRLDFDAAPDRAWIGTVARIIPQADLRSRSFPVRIQLENLVIDGVPLLKGGMLARAWLPVGATDTMTVVPKDALVLGGPSPIVFCIDSTDGKTGTVRPVAIALGAAIEGHVAVRSGLEPGLLVVVRGNERLRPGMQVTFEAPSE